MGTDFDPVTPARLEWRDQIPYSTEFGDGYFAREGGLEEARAVFIAGNRLPERFAALKPGKLFVIGETGFGTGLNMLLAARLFAERAPTGARLSLISVEKHPLAAADMQRAVSAWPTLKALADRLVARYPPPVPGWHRIGLSEAIDLTVMHGDALAMWRQQEAAVDAWFLDGFAPDRNPALWSRALLAELAGHSRPGATLATFTAAGRVRRRLAEVGFSVQRRPGFGAKRHRLEGRRRGDWSPRAFVQGTALVAGAGLAGATTARALAERGWRVQVFDPGGVAPAASGNRAGVVYTTPAGGTNARSRYDLCGYLHALRWFARPGVAAADIGRFDGVVQHIVGQRQRRRLQAAITSGLWPESLLRPVGEDTMLLEGAGYLRPDRWCRALLDHPAIGFDQRGLARLDPAGRPVLDHGRPVEADAVVVCIAGAAHRLGGLPPLPLTVTRGQVTACRATRASRAWRRAHCHDGYLTPAVDGVHLVGATFDPHETDPAPRAADDRANLESLRGHLPARWQALGGEDIEIVGQRVAFRCHTPDYLPMAGLAPANWSQQPLALNLGYGSRGIAGTPLAAELIADTLSGLPGTIDPVIAAALDPARFVGVSIP